MFVFLSASIQRKNILQFSNRIRTRSSWYKKIIISLYSVYVQPHHDYCVQFWNLQFRKEVKILESVLRRSTELVRELEGASQEGWLRTLCLSALEKRRLRGDVIALYRFLGGKIVEGGADHFSLAFNNRTCGNVQNCTSGDLGCILGSICFLKGWSNTGTGLRGSLSMP